MHSQESATDCRGVALDHEIQSAAFVPESPRGAVLLGHFAVVAAYDEAAGAVDDGPRFEEAVIRLPQAVKGRFGLEME